MIVKERIRAFIEQFSERESFTRKELYDFFKSKEPKIDENIFSWRIYVLKRKGIIKSLKRGVYTFFHKPEFEYPTNRKLSIIFKSIKNRYDLENICVWDTAWLHDFMLHQPTLSYKIIEVDKEGMESVFYYLKDENHKNVFLYPDEPLMDRYVSEKIKPIIIKPFISRSPVIKVKNNIYSMIEKMLVDIYCEPVLFKVYQSSELVRIFTQVNKQYALNLSKIMNYAKRRGKGSELGKFLVNEIKISQELIL